MFSGESLVDDGEKDTDEDDVRFYSSWLHTSNIILYFVFGSMFGCCCLLSLMATFGPTRNESHSCFTMWTEHIGFWYLKFKNWEERHKISLKFVQRTKTFLKRNSFYLLSNPLILVQQKGISSLENRSPGSVLFYSIVSIYLFVYKHYYAYNSKFLPSIVCFLLSPIYPEPRITWFALQ